MITIKNSQRKFLINKTNIAKDLMAISSFVGCGGFSISLTLVSSKAMQQYNRLYRGKDKPTDILSFAFYPDHKPGEPLILKPGDPADLGDLLICPERVAADAKEYGVSFDFRLRELLVHGVCHLLGYDHELDSDYELMHAQERRILAFLSGDES